LSWVTNDIDNLTTTLQQGLSQLLTSVLTICGVLGMMFWISPLLAGISAVTIPLALVVTFFVARRSQVQFSAQWERTGTLNGLVEETHTGHTLVQVFGRRKATIDEFDRQNGRLYDASFRAQFLSGVIQPTMQFIANVNYVVIAVLGGYRVASGLLSLGDVTAFIQYSRQFTMPITQIAGQMNMLQSGLASAERVFEFLDAGEEVADAAPVTELGLRPQSRGSVKLEHVFFRYEPDKPLIEDFNLDVSPGKTIAIVGPTGAGKTTMVNLLVRFYEIDSGRILLDGIDYRDLTRDEVRNTFGMVLQDTWLFAGTIRDNIAYGKPGATDEEIIAAAEAAYVDHFVRTEPDGYDTLLDEEASNVSSGQKQLLTIARAFLADPSILILDEATSNVDTRTEVLIQTAMARLRKGRTSFVIAHRLSTIRDADMIIVMDGGHIVEQGSHVELLARAGLYYSLYNSQFTEAAAS
jgi:ATP-binding cassette subfamily B protein